jgi:hypothetical protein
MVCVCVGVCVSAGMRVERKKERELRERGKHHHQAVDLHQRHHQISFVRAVGGTCAHPCTLPIQTSGYNVQWCHCDERETERAGGARVGVRYGE